jgi:chromosomal replication initiator protein
MNASSPLHCLLSVPEQYPARVALHDLLAGAGPLLLVLHGSSGSGKSKLVQWFVDQAPTCSVIAAGDLKAERSTRISEDCDTTDEDFLVVEDLQFLPLNAVETFVERLDERQARNLPTIITASAGPRHLRFRGQLYPARLTARLAAGLVVDVPLPRAATRRSVLDELLRSAHLEVPESVVAPLAEQSRSLRSLIGAVHQLELLAKLQPGPFQAGPLLDHFRKQWAADKTTVDRIVQSVAGHFHVAVKDVRSHSRRRGIVVPRHVGMYLARQLTPLSFQQIGAYFGGCDHATVLHACRKMEKTLAGDPHLGGAVRQLHDDLA